MRRVMVTGGAGFIGANFTRYWIANHPGDEVTVLDALTYAGSRDNLTAVEEQPLFRFVQGDITDEALITKLLIDRKIDTIVHFAAESHVDRSIHGPDEFINTNIVGTHVMLKSAKNIWLGATTPRSEHRFHHVSTDEVFGSLDISAPAFNETTSYDPSSPYSASKAASDHLVRAYHRTYGLNVSISNCSNNYGPFHYPEKLIPLTIINILIGKSIPVYGKGSNIRDWLYVDEHCRGLELILEKGIVGETYNIGANCEATNIDVVLLICNHVDRAFTKNPKLTAKYPLAPPANSSKSESLITFVDDRPGHDVRYAMDITKISRELGFAPETTFEDGLSRTVQWYLNNQEWWALRLDSSYSKWIELQYA